VDNVLNEIRINIIHYEVIAYTDPYRNGYNLISKSRSSEAEEHLLLRTTQEKRGWLKKKTANELDSLHTYEYEKGINKFKEADYLEAITAFKDALSTQLQLRKDDINSDKVASCYYNIARCYQEQGKFIAAYGAFLQARLIASTIKAPDQTLIKYLKKLVEVGTRIGHYQETLQYLGALKKLNCLPEDKDALEIFIYEAQRICNIQANDPTPQLKSNPYGNPLHANQIGNGEIFSIGVTQTKTASDGSLIGKTRFFQYHTRLKNPDPSNKEKALQDALDAKRKGQQDVFQRIIMCFPSEERRDFFQYIQKNGIVDSKQFSEELPPRPLNEEDSYMGDPVEILTQEKKPLSLS
jgi:tetratricopeptide (TPR) repeat protein